MASIRFSEESGVSAQTVLLLGAWMIPLGTVRKLIPVSDEAPMNRKQLRRSRIAAFKRQRGCCYYCNQPMWESDSIEFASRHRLTAGRLRQRRSTAEHLLARCDGGDDRPANIAAACWECNKARHRRKRAMSPSDWRENRLKRLARLGPGMFGARSELTP